MKIIEHPSRSGVSRGVLAADGALQADEPPREGAHDLLRLRKLHVAAPAPAPGMKPEVVQGYQRLFAFDYFERWGHWSTGGPRQLPKGAAPAAA